MNDDDEWPDPGPDLYTLESGATVYGKDAVAMTESGGGGK
jgi:hypothetical protein